MSTLGTIITRVTSELTRPDLTAEASAAVITAVKFFENERFFFNEGRATLETSAGQAEYPLPLDFQGISNVVIEVSEYTYELNEKPYTWIVAVDSNANYLGRPYDYAIYAEMLRVYPKPIEAYTLTMSYFRKFDISASLSASSVWFTEGEELIRLHTKVDLLENKIRGAESFQEAGVLRAREQEVLDRLRAESSKRMANTYLMPTQF